MTEEQAIERIEAAMDKKVALADPSIVPLLVHAAWNEIKAIAREEVDEGPTVTPRQIAREAIAQLASKLCGRSAKRR